MWQRVDQDFGFKVSRGLELCYFAYYNLFLLAIRLDFFSCFWIFLGCWRILEMVCLETFISYLRLYSISLWKILFCIGDYILEVLYSGFVTF